MSDNQYDAIIIGAGMAGIGAAREIAEASGRVLIVEASDMVGGRIKTIDGINHGATWLHGRDDDPLLPVVKSYGLGYTLDPAEKNLQSYYKGSAHGPEFREAMGEAMFAGLQRAQEANPKADASINQALSDHEQGKDSAAYFRRVWFSARSDDTLSLRAAMEDPFGPGGYVLKDGMSALPKKMAEALPSGTIRLNTPIAAIKRDGDNYTIQTAKGETLSARGVIFTGSVGVIQSGNVDMREVMSPAMQEQTSSKNVTMGNMNKVVFRLPTDYLERNPSVVNGHRDLVDESLFVHTGLGGKPLITVFFGGEDADRLEKMKPEDAKNEVLAALKKNNVLPEADMIYPILEEQKPTITNWGQTPYVQGAYSNVVVGGTPNLEPLQNGKFLMAGEAFSPNSGHVSGAYLSGQMAGQKLAAELGLVANVAARKAPAAPDHRLVS